MTDTDNQIVKATSTGWDLQKMLRRVVKTCKETKWMKETRKDLKLTNNGS